MASTQYRIKGSTADGDIISDDMSPIYERLYVSVTFYTDSTYTTSATPSAGTITFRASEDGINYGTIQDGTITANVVEYTRPNASGLIKKIKATCSGITGASNYIATLSRYGGDRG